MDADETAARLDVALERRLLFVVEDVAGGAQEDHHFVLLEFGVIEDARRVFGPEDVEVVELAEVTDGVDGFVDGFVVPAGGFCEQQDAELLLFGVGGGGAE